MFYDIEEPKMTVEDKLKLVANKQAQIDAMEYEKNLIEGDIVRQIKTDWYNNPNYNILCWIQSDFYEKLSGRFEEKKDDKKYREDIDWALKLICNKLKLDDSFKFYEMMLFYGAGFGAPPCDAEFFFEWRDPSGKPTIYFEISLPIYDNVVFRDYKYMLSGTRINYKLDKDSCCWDFACADLDYTKLADKFAEWRANAGWAKENK